MGMKPMLALKFALKTEGTFGALNICMYIYGVEVE